LNLSPKKIGEREKVAKGRVQTAPVKNEKVGHAVISPAVSRSFTNRRRGKHKKGKDRQRRKETRARLNYARKNGTRGGVMNQARFGQKREKNSKGRIRQGLHVEKSRTKEPENECAGKRKGSAFLLKTRPGHEETSSYPSTQRSRRNGNPPQTRQPGTGDMARKRREGSGREESTQDHDTAIMTRTGG